MDVDVEQILHLRERTDEMRKVEKQASMAREPNERESLNKMLKTLRRQVAAAQRQVLSTYPLDYVTCRDIGHRWYLKEEEVHNGQLDRVLVCDCTMIRHESLSRFGELLNRSYTPPEGYYVSSQITGSQRYNKQFWRGISYMAVAART